MVRLIMSIPVIDFHVHPVVYEKMQPWVVEYIFEMNNYEGDLEEYKNYFSKPANFIDYLGKNGVKYAVVLAEYCPVTTGICSNEAVAEFCNEHSSLIPFASVDFNSDKSPGEFLKFHVEEYGFKGVKLYPTYQFVYPNDKNLYPLYDVAQHYQIPVMLHTGTSIFKGSRLKYGNPLFLDDVAVDFPQLNILLVHGGRGCWYQEAFTLAKLHSNVYIEIAGLPPERLLNYFPELEKIPEKFIFGSDWPGVPGIKQNIEDFLSLPIAADSKEKILYSNAAKLLSLAI